MDDSLHVDGNDCDRLTRKLMLCSMGSKNDRQISKTELRDFTTMLMTKCYSKQKFDEENFERGYAKLDRDGKGFVDFDQIKDLVSNHFHSIGLHK